MFIYNKHKNPKNTFQVFKFLFLVITLVVTFSQVSFATVLKREKVDRWYESKGFIRHVEKCLSFAERKFYIEHIQNVFKQYQIPKDLIYLPVIESCYNPFAISRAGAIGMWQINDITARHLKLRQGLFLDDRLNWQKSTEAAAKYLLFLKERFPNWTLVLAAYNVGPGYVRSQMKRRKTIDVEKLRLPRETKDYVYKFAAMMRHIHESEQRKELAKNEQ